MIMPFGKHEGEHMEDIPSSYLRWLVENLDEDKEDIIQEAEDELLSREHFHLFSVHLLILFFYFILNDCY